MKKFIAIYLIVVIVISLTACGQRESIEISNHNTNNQKTGEIETKMLSYTL